MGLLARWYVYQRDYQSARINMTLFVLARTAGVNQPEIAGHSAIHSPNISRTLTPKKCLLAGTLSPY
jgi:hypothetical protein